MTGDDFFGKLGDFLDKSAQNIKDRLTFDVTDLIRAIDKNDADQVERVLRAGVDPNKRDGLYRLALPIAVDNNIAEIVGMLLSAGANPNLRDQNGDTALYKAVYWENETIIELLLKKGADINQPNGLGVSPLQEAKNLGRADMITLLEGYVDDEKTQQIEEDKKTHAELKVKAEEARKRREEAAAKEHEMEIANKAKAEEAAKLELEKVYGVDGEGYLRPLLKAMQSKDSEAVKTFIEKVEDLNAFDVFYNSTPLMMAIQLQNSKLSKFLIEKGADGLSYVATLKHSAFTKAVSHNMYDLVTVIIEKNREVITDYINNPEQLLSPQFLSYKDARMMDVLLGAGADPNFGGKEAPSPIVKAIEKAGLGILPVLAKNKVDLNFKTGGKSLLEWAIFYNRTDWVTGLLAEGVDPKLINENGQNALEYAESLEDRMTIVTILKEEMEE
jgi:ankyrin repeat protein